MSIKSKVIKTLVDKKNFTRQDIYKAIYKAQGKEIPSKFPVGFYGTNINHWERDLLIERVSRGNYKIGKKAKVYLQFPKIYRKYIKEERQKRQNYYHQQWEKRQKIRKLPHITHADNFQFLVGKTIKSVRYLTPNECANFGWNKSPLVMFLNDGTIMIPQCDDEGNDGGAMMLIDKNKNIDVGYTI